MIALAALFSFGCHSADLRGPGPTNPSVIGNPGNRAVENPPTANQGSNFGYGSAYDPHGSGSLAQPGTPGENGAIPLYLGPPVGSNYTQPGVPPKVPN